MAWLGVLGPRRMASPPSAVVPAWQAVGKGYAMILPVLLGIVGAGFLGTGFVVQQREAAQVASNDSFSVRLLWKLMGRRLWWSGIASMAMGYVLIGLSLGTGNLVLVEPLIAANLIFALPVAAAWCRRVPQRRSMLGAVGLAAGVAGFVLAAQPNGGRSDNVPVLNWLVAACIAGTVI